MHLDPIKPTLKAPVIKLLKLKCDDLRSKFAFKFDLRRYIKAANAKATPAEAPSGIQIMVRQCRLTPSNPS